MNKCLTCGYVFENDERSEYKERLEHFGTPCYMVEYACPICGGEYEETKRCSRCDGNFLEEELFDGICDNCLNEVTYHDISFTNCDADCSKVDTTSDDSQEWSDNVANQ